MTRALAEAARGRGAVEPNPMVGAVLVRDDVLIGVGHHARFGGDHAEVAALANLGDAARGATLYVTLEPCCHHGKTPPCTQAILRAGVSRVVVAMADPFPRVAGGGLQELRAAGVQVETGVLQTLAEQLSAAYLKRILRGRPYVTAKWAMTLDGRLATGSGSSQWITNPRSRSIVHEIRGRMDAIVIGIGTALADDPQLTARPPGPKSPARIVLDSRARLPLDAKLVVTARETPTMVAVSADAPDSRVRALTDRGCEVIRFEVDGRIPIPLLLDEMGRKSWTNLLIEGGGRTLGAFFDADEVDAVEAFIAPSLVGGEPNFVPFLGRGEANMKSAHRLASVEVSQLDGDLHLSGRFSHSWLNHSST